jgi:hypothetical protein
MKTTPNTPRQKAIAAGVLSLLLGLPVYSATFTLNPSMDAFVTTGPSGTLSGNNYGGAGALDVAAPGLAKGEFQSVLQFDLSGARASFDTQFGAGQWNIQSITLSLTATSPNNAIFIVGYIPARLGKMNPAGMEILVQGDPLMHRPFIVMEANPKKFPQANHAGARALSDFLLSPKAQRFLAEFGQKTTGRGPLFHPVQTATDDK